MPEASQTAPPATSMAVAAELHMAVATVQVVRFELRRPIDDVIAASTSFRLNLSLTPRMPNTRMSYRRHWEPHRFERAGVLFLAAPGEDLHVRSDQGQQDTIICELLPAPLATGLDADVRWNERRLEESLDIGNAVIRGLMLRLGEEARNPGFASDILSEAIAVQLAVELGRHFAAVTDLPRRGGIAPWRLRLIDERLHDVASAPTLADLAILTGLSVRQLTRGFRASRGCSIGDHVAGARIDHAKRLLMRGESVKAVAHAMRFATPSGFCHAFRQATGLAPRAWRDDAAGRAH